MEGKEMKNNKAIIQNYLKVCQNAILNKNVYDNFKNNRSYTKILEHVGFDCGQDYLNEVKEHFPFLLRFISKFITNDKIGNPVVFNYEDIGFAVSPTTLRYVKILGDLMNFFGGLDNLNIVEIGGGYGGQCKIIYDIAKPKSYTIIDLPEVLPLVSKYLKEFDINDVILKNPRDRFEKNYDLFISNYSFTELIREEQEYYNKNIIQKSACGYMICNFIGGRKSIGRKDVKKLHSTGEFYPECPLTYPTNTIYVWNSNHK
jgi:putative sugar O-methyltransferase